MLFGQYRASCLQEGANPGCSLVGYLNKTVFTGDYLRKQENQPWEYVASYTLGIVMLASWVISTP